MIQIIVKILVLFDRHPWDWLAHGFLGFIIFILNLGIVRMIDLCFYTPLYLMTTPVILFGSINFVIAVELTQWDIFGISKKMLIDSGLDLIADMAGIGIGLWILI
jgi:hypothetical protein